VELEIAHDELENAGARVIAVAAAPTNSVASWRSEARASFPVLADTDHTVSTAYGVYNLFGDGTAGPAAFIIDQDGTIIWHEIGQTPETTFSGQEILDHLP